MYGLNLPDEALKPIYKDIISLITAVTVIV